MGERSKRKSSRPENGERSKRKSSRSREWETLETQVEPPREWGTLENKSSDEVPRAGGGVRDGKQPSN